MEWVLSIAVGVGLAAACGFRVFVPALVVGLAGRFGEITLAPGFEWATSDLALVTLGVATVLEIGAYYVPWLDNALDTVALPSAAVAGFFVMAATTPELDPGLRYGLATVAGAGVATTTQVGTTAVRAASTAISGGLTNFMVSTAELIGATLLSVLAIMAPLIAIALLAAIAVIMVRRRMRRVSDA